MTLGELLLAIAMGAGTMASVLGIFYTWVSRRNHHDMRELMQRLDREHRELTERLDRGHREQLMKMDDTQRLLGELIVADGERTRQLTSREVEGLRRIISNR